MDAPANLNLILKDPLLDPALRKIADKVLNEERITKAEGILLYEKGDLAYVGALANHIREKRHGDRTYFNRNFHVEPTNVCLYTCTFCSYSRLIKKRSEGWEYSMEEIMDIIREYDEQPVTEVHIVGGVLPQYNLKFYDELFRKIRAHRPSLHIKALTPVEYHYIFLLQFGREYLGEKSLPLHQANALMLRCSMDILSLLNIEFIIWNYCVSCRIEQGAFKHLFL